MSLMRNILEWIGIVSRQKLFYIGGSDVLPPPLKGQDEQDTLERFQVVIYAEREREFQHDPASARRFYYGYVRDNERECADTVGRFRLLKEAKIETLKLFNRYMELFASQTSGESESRDESQSNYY